MAKVISFLLALCMLPVLYGCQYDVDILEKGSYSWEAADFLSGDLEPDYAMNDGTTIGPATLVDTDDVVAMLLGVSNTTVAPELMFVFDKGNNERIDFEVDYVVVDGWQCSGEIFPPHESMSLSFLNFSSDYVKFPGELNIETDPLTECGLLEEIHEIELSYRLVGDSHTEFSAEGIYTAATSNDGEPIPYSSDGPVLLDEEGIFVQLYAFQPDTYAGTGEDCDLLILYVENNSNRRIFLTVDDAEVYEKSDSEEEEKTDDTRTVIAQKEKNGRYTDSVPLYGSMNVCAGKHSLGSLQTADLGNVVSLSDDEELAFSLKVYDYDKYDSEDLSDPMFERNVTLTTEDLSSPD